MSDGRTNLRSDEGARREAGEARVELGATQEQVGEFVGIDCTTVGKIERGERNTNLHNIIRLAYAVGIDPGALLSGLTVKMVPDRKPVRALRQMRKLRRKHGLD